MKHIAVKLVGVILLGCCLYACGKYHSEKHRKTADAFNESAVGSANEWVLYRCKDFSIQFPPIFRIDSSGYRKTRLIIYTDLTKDGDMYEDNISISVTERENNLSLEAYGKQCEGYIKQYTESPEVISSGLKKRGEQEYFEIIYSESQSDFRLFHEQQILFSGKMRYSMTLSCEDAVFDQCREVGESIMSTLAIPHS